jgi:DNA-binding FrmR family transcriptional regulator
MLEEVRTLRGDLREKLGKAQQTAALEEMAKSDSLETEAFEALYSLFHSTQNASKDRLLYIVHERLTLLISRHRSLQGVGFLPPDLSARTELETSWKRLLTLIDDQISLVTETYHKLTVDDVDTRAKLETLLEERKPELTEAPAFAIGFDYLSELVAAIRQMIEQTDNLTDVIKEIRDVDSSLRQCELTMQDNYYKLKPVVGVEDCRKRERKRTFLTITHAEPLTPKEGIYILTDIIAALKKNANNLFEIENKRVQVVENSLNVKRAREALELLHEVSGAERVLRLDSANQLLSIPGAGEEARQASLLAQGLTPCQVSIPPLSDCITVFLTEVLPWLQESLAYDQALNRLIRKAAFYLD